MAVFTNISRTSQSICWSQSQISRRSGLIRDAKMLM